MKNRILISILCLMVAVPFMAFADINITEGYDADGIVPISDSTEELISSQHIPDFWRKDCPSTA